jgi:iron(III) transport system ATP-binding protein
VQAVRIEQVTKRFDNTTAVAGANLDIRPGELFTLLGPSGCGKTTLLRMLAGLERPDSGTIHFAEERVDDLPAHRRNIGMVFQNYAVFPHMSVAENVAYGLRARKLPEARVREQVAEALELVRMGEYGGRRPDQLSGGQQQRVALARALATRPGLLLMDEPLSNLDAKLRQAMREEIRRLQKAVGITTLYVTHDQEEALAISDRIGVMEAGRLLQVGTPVEIYSRPVHRAVAAFVGTCSFIAGRVPGSGGREALVGLRPERVQPMSPGAVAHEGLGVLDGEAAEETFMGAFSLLRVALASGEEVAALSFSPPGSFPEGVSVRLAYRPEQAYYFDPVTGEAMP